MWCVRVYHAHRWRALCRRRPGKPCPPGPSRQPNRWLWISSSRRDRRTTSVTLIHTTPTRLSAYPLNLLCLHTVSQASYSVCNVVDVTIPTLKAGAQADVPEGNGTGIVWDKEGNIVTNYHVIGSVLAQASRSAGDRKLLQVARVTLLGTDGFTHEYVADLVGADRSKDLAVLRISAPEELLRPTTLGGPVRVGQSVYAIGNPFGFDLTLTSGLARSPHARARAHAHPTAAEQEGSIPPPSATPHSSTSPLSSPDLPIVTQPLHNH